jgi:hypothetical protein
MNLEVSIGEAIDKLSILELKIKKIDNEQKRCEIQKEINALQECHKYKDNHLYYNLLMYANEKIWDMTDLVKSITIEDPKFGYISNQIFEFNQKRFRVKNWFNLINSSNIKEQKSYAVSHCKIMINNIGTFYDKISEIIFLALEHDMITIVSNFNEKIQKILDIPTITYLDFDSTIESELNETTIPNSINLETFEIQDKNILPFFELKPITYVSGGLLGDFIHQLSIINETFLNTGRKGILYIANNIGGDNFRYDLSKTFEDTYKVISQQSYIKEYKIYTNEQYDINLSGWRNSRLLLKTSWDKIFCDIYNVEWGTHPWIHVPKNDMWKDTILVTTTSYRPAYNINFAELCEKYGETITILDFSDSETNFFKKTFNAVNVATYKPVDLYDLSVAINSCKLFIGNMSSPLTFAYAVHKQSIVGLHHPDDIHHLGLEKIIQNVIINKHVNIVMEKIKVLCNYYEM